MERKTQCGKIIDLRSLVIGLLLGSCLILVSGYSGNSANGRYQCSASAGLWVFIIDTQTGQTWKLDDSATADFGTPQNRKSQQSYISPKS